MDVLENQLNSLAHARIYPAMRFNVALKFAAPENPVQRQCQERQRDERDTPGCRTLRRTTALDGEDNVNRRQHIDRRNDETNNNDAVRVGHLLFRAPVEQSAGAARLGRLRVA